MSAEQLDQARAEFEARGSKARRPPVPRPAIRVDRPRPPFPIRRFTEVVAGVAFTALLALRVFDALGVG